MGKKWVRMLVVVWTAAVLTAGCSQKDTQQGNDGGAVTIGREDIILPEDELPEQSQEGSTPVESGQLPDVPAHIEESPVNPSENDLAGNLPSQTENADRSLLPVYRIRHVYGGILSMLAAAYELPDLEIEKEDLYDGTYLMSDNRFAVTDVDGDGREELIILYSTACMAGMFGVIYDYNPNTMALTRELLDFTELAFYDNGIVIALESHNHSLGEELYPYTMYQYNPQTDQYDFLADISSWDKALADVNYQGMTFPDALDEDGDGVIYEIDTDPDRSGEPVRYDGDDFNEWISQKMEGASEIQISYEPVALDRFRNFSTDHLTLLHDIAEEDAGVSQTDIGWLYIRQGSLDNARKYLSDHYAVDWKANPEFEEEYTGSVGGNEVFSLIFMDGGILSYNGSRVEDVTIFGIYPGMDADMAVTTLMSYGFYPKDNLENYMITGDGVGNAAVSYEIVNGVITDISVSAYCSYAG